MATTFSSEYQLNSIQFDKNNRNEKKNKSSLHVISLYIIISTSIQFFTEYETQYCFVDFYKRLTESYKNN